ncbi:FAD-dependent oxidoreductase [Actinopolymorpha sp. B11F2]|uniref:NAD(P)/FAD-dependent oxidoreductase n=1 Tax=Actinopolymorpha sp. B11F2 TaxID=3160862 RepID=UPI0032E3C116
MTHHIVVLGAGYAGLGAATGLARLVRGTGTEDDVKVTLVNATDRFVERVRLHQVATGQQLPDLPLPGLLAGTGVDLVVARVSAVDVERRRVRLDAAPGSLSYDTLVCAWGSGADVDSVPGVRVHAYTLAEAGQAERLHACVRAVPSGGVVAVVGGGLTGIEAATELAEAHPRLRVELVTGERVGGWLSERARRHLRRAFVRMGIGVHEGARVAEVDAGGLRLGDGAFRGAAACVWAAGFRVPTLARAAGLAVDRRGRMLVDDTLRSVSHPDVYGIGDVAAAPTPGGSESRMSCQTSLPMGRYVAGSIAATLEGRAPKPIRIRYVWQNISLGRRDGVTQFTGPDDSPTGAVLTGRVSAAFKEAVTRGTVVALRHPRRDIGRRGHWRRRSSSDGTWPPSPDSDVRRG